MAGLRESSCCSLCIVTLSCVGSLQWQCPCKLGDAPRFSPCVLPWQGGGWCVQSCRLSWLGAAGQLGEQRGRTVMEYA